MTHPTVPPKVTVILPTYNRAAYLTQAIDSIRAQTLKDWELIIIDDASTDNTPEVAQDVYATRLTYPLPSPPIPIKVSLLPATQVSNMPAVLISHSKTTMICRTLSVCKNKSKT